MRDNVARLSACERDISSSRCCVSSIDIGFGIALVPKSFIDWASARAPGRSRPGARADAQPMKDFGTSAIPNPMSMLLTQQRELEMSRSQADSLATLSRIFSVFADSVWTPAVARLIQLPEVYSHGEAYRDYVSARERTVDFLITLIPRVNGLLTSCLLYTSPSPRDRQKSRMP